MTVHRDKFLIIKPNRCNIFSNLFLEWNSTCFGQFLCPSSGVFHCTHGSGLCYASLLTACEQDHMLLLTSCQQTCMIYTIAVCMVKNGWWTEFHSTNKFEKLVHLVGFSARNLSRCTVTRTSKNIWRCSKQWVIYMSQEDTGVLISP